MTMMGISLFMLMMAALSMVTLNVNGIHDPHKWPDLKSMLPNSDIICLQETHLTKQQEFAFQLHTQSYDWFFSHGTSNLAGVAMGVHRHAGITGIISGEVSGRLLAVDFQGMYDFRCGVLYTPNGPHEQFCFFEGLHDFVRDNMILLGDFNSVTSSNDHLSGNLDLTSVLLQNILQLLSFVEILGSHCHIFLYHDPTISSHKSRIDCIYTNFAFSALRGYASPCGLSDHYLLGCFTVLSNVSRPKQWQFPLDLLGDVSFDLQIQLILDNFDWDNTIESWETIKLKVQSLAQRMTCFRQKQAKQELQSLHSLLTEVNK